MNRARVSSLGFPVTAVLITALLVVLLPVQQAAACPVKVLHSFAGGADGQQPTGDLVRDKKGDLYGTTNTGGTFGFGTVFKITPRGGETVLYSFSGGADGGGPIGTTLDEEGNIYGVTYGGGLNGFGTVFKLAPSGAETVLYNFDELVACPKAPVVLDQEGNIYGTTDCYTPTNSGAVFKLTPDGSFSVLHSFSDAGTDGYAPGQIILDEAGNVYGETYYGGTYGEGTIFELTPSGAEFILHDFTGGANGQVLKGRLHFAKGGLIGTAGFGGEFKSGTVFRMTWAGSFQVLYNFAGEPDGFAPTGPVVLTRDGDIFGTTEMGGGGNGYGWGTVFRLSRDGKESILHRFVPVKKQKDGLIPEGLVLCDGGNLCGTTSEGGIYGRGTVFKVER